MSDHDVIQNICILVLTFWVCYLILKKQDKR